MARERSKGAKRKGGSLKGKLLIASPGLTDPNFARSVVLIAEHTPQGALGLVLNRPTDLKLQTLWSTISEKSAPLGTEACAFVGGPVQKNAVFVLHGYDDLADGTDPVIPGVYLGSDVELFDRLMVKLGGEPVPVSVRVFCGYAGWGAGQLDREMEQGGWLVADATSALVFDAAIDTLWSRTLASRGGIYRFLALMPPRPELN
jgi:putative transcriptional regulator